jgi:glycosyltransferase involved in cell wall biosynthesis
MRIGLAARWLDLPPGGAREYTLNLIRALLELDHQNEYIIFYGDPANVGLFPAASEIVVRARNKLWWDYGPLPAAVARSKIDLFWTPSYVVPFPIRCKSVASVLDLAYFTLPQSYEMRDVVYMRLAIPGSFRKAQALLAISEYTKQDLVRLFPFAKEKVTVTHLAAPLQYHARHDPERLHAVQVKYSLPLPYIFYSGSVSPRKGLPYLLEALAKLKSRNPPHRLVLTGGWSWGKVDLRALIERLGLQDQVVFLGSVPGEDMPPLYELADLFVYPSLYEGFGLPVLEPVLKVPFSTGLDVLSSGESWR